MKHYQAKKGHQGETGKIQRGRGRDLYCSLELVESCDESVPGCQEVAIIWTNRRRSYVYNAANINMASYRWSLLNNTILRERS